MRYYPPAKQCKLDSPWVGPYLVVSLVGWAVGVQLQPDSPIILGHCQDVKKIPHPSGLVPWIDVALPEGSPAPPILGASTVCRSTQNFASASIVPPVNRSLLSGGASVDSGWSLPGSLPYNPECSVIDVCSQSRGSVVTFLTQEVLLVDISSSWHPFFVHQMDVGPIRLMSIAHALNYRVAVLRYGVKSASRVGHSRRAAGRILEDIGLPWGHQVVVMFQIVCALALEVPSVRLDLENLHGLSPNVILAYEPRGHRDHDGEGCECLSSDSTGAFVHDLSLAPCGRDSSNVAGEAPMEGARDEDYRARGVDLSQDCGLAELGTSARDWYPLYLIDQGLTVGCS